MLTGEYKFLDASVINYINNVIKDNKRFIEERFQLWIENNEIENKNNPSAFVNKCFLKELRRGTFTKPESPKIEYVPPMVPFYNHLREVGIKVRSEDQFLLEESFTYLVGNNIITHEELATLNSQIIEYLLTLPEEKRNTDEFIKLLMKSKTLSGRFIDWNEIGNRAKKDEEEWEKLMKFFREYESND